MHRKSALLPLALGPAAGGLLAGQSASVPGALPLVALLLGAGGLSLVQALPGLWRVLGTVLSSLLLLGSTWLTQSADPFTVTVFGFLVAVIALLSSFPEFEERTRAAIFPVTALACALLVLESVAPNPWCVALLVTGWLIHWSGALRGRLKAGTRALHAVGLGVSLAAALLAVSWREPASRLLLLLLADVLCVFVAAPSETGQKSLWGALLEEPARLLVSTFALLCLVGTLILRLPLAATSSQPIPLLDAAFTAVSAVCVTGLSVIDVGTVFSFGGQLGLLVLIQVGGLGIMTFYTVGLTVLGERLSLKQERAMASALSLQERGTLSRPTRRILAVTLVTEGVGAICLVGLFLAEGVGVRDAIWRGVFTAVSAFNNAGFALQSDNLVQYQGNPLILHVVGLLIVLGGLAPATVLAIPAWVQGKSILHQQRLALVTSLLLLVLGAVAYGLTEWHFTLSELSPWDKVHNAWFQSVTLRTAGFNSVDLTATQDATQLIMVFFMFVGGSPGGTAGGIKTATLAIVLLTVGAMLTGRHQVVYRRRLIDQATVYKAAAVAFTGSLVAFVMAVALQLTQNLEPQVAIFEVVSALATVGLTIGGTSQLDSVGKLIVMACMFAGRVGPLTLFFFLTSKNASRANHSYPETKVDVG